MTDLTGYVEGGRGSSGGDFWSKVSGVSRGVDGRPFDKKDEKEWERGSSACEECEGVEGAMAASATADDR